MTQIVNSIDNALCCIGAILMVEGVFRCLDKNTVRPNPWAPFLLGVVTISATVFISKQ